MKSMAAPDAPWLRRLWIGTLVGLNAILTVTYTCIAPFAALGVAAAMTLSARQAVLAMAAAWLANQAAGFLVLSYPWTLGTFGWGVAVGAGAIAGTLAALWLLRTVEVRRPRTQVVATFVLTFTVYQLALYAAAALVLGGTGAFVPGIIAQVLIVNVVALVGLWSLNHILAAAFSSYRRRASAVPARFA